MNKAITFFPTPLEIGECLFGVVRAGLGRRGEGRKEKTSLHRKIEGKNRVWICGGWWFGGWKSSLPYDT